MEEIQLVLATDSTKTGAWLRLAMCLAVSVGMHAALGSLRWETPVLPPLAEAPSMAIVLVEAPSATESPRTITAPSAAPAKPAAPARSKSAAKSPAPAPVDSPPVTEPPPSVETDPLGDEETAGVTAGGAAGDSAVMAVRPLSRKRDEGGEAVGLIKATPRYETNPLPQYPRLARQNHWEGTVRIRARVTAAGTVESVRLERSSGHAVLDRSALDGVQSWHFIPATRGGIPVDCEVSIPVAFRLKE